MLPLDPVWISAAVTIGGGLFAVQVGILAYCVKIEHRLTHLETVVQFIRETK